MLKDFKEFALKGNAVDLAIGVIIGGAFGGIVTSLVNDVMMPPIGKLLGGVDFSNFFVVLGGGDYPSLKAANSQVSDRFAALVRRMLAKEPRERPENMAEVLREMRFGDRRAHV